MMRTALITGATSGIGKALAYLMAKKGMKLILTGRHAKRLSEVACDVHAQQIIVADLSKKEERQKLIEIIERDCPDLVVNNAGYTFYGDPLSLDLAEQLAIAEVNAIAPLELTLVAVRTWIKQKKKGIVMNISSIAGEHPTPGMSVYGASKAFVTSFSQAINTEVSEYGIHVLVSCPGLIATEFARRAARNSEIKPHLDISAEYAADQVWKQILKKEEKHIFNWRYRLSSLFAKTLIPTSIVKNIIWKEIKQRVRR